jgi:Flp pilus assembly protein TadB
MRVDIKAILADPVKRRDMTVRTCIALQARAGIETTREQMEKAYDTVQAEKGASMKKDMFWELVIGTGLANLSVLLFATGLPWPALVAIIGAGLLWIPWDRFKA